MDGTSQVEAQAIHVASPMGDLIAAGEKTLLVKTHRFDLAGREFMLAQEGAILGRVKFGDAVKVEGIGKLESLQERHRIMAAERQSWWGDSRVFWTWPVEVLDRPIPPSRTRWAGCRL